MKVEDLPDADLICVFELLPTLTVIKVLALVSRQFRRIAQSADFWRTKLHALPPVSDGPLLLGLHYPWQELQLAPGNPQALVEKLEGHHAAYSKLWYQLYKTNMVEQPNFGGNSTGGAWRSRTNSAPWRVTLHGGQGWQCEGPDPIGVESWRYCQLPSLHASNRGQFTYAIASSYSWGEVMQAVDLQGQLQKRGMTAQEAADFLDNSPDITFSVWCGGRFDCPSKAEVVVVLDAQKDVLPPYVGRRDFPWQRSAVVYVSTGPMQTVAGEWRLYSHTFQAYGRGVRRALLILRGKDDQFWAGHYGSKYAAPELHFGPSRWHQQPGILHMPAPLPVPVAARGELA